MVVLFRIYSVAVVRMQGVYRVILKPIQTPAIAPIALNNRVDIEKDDAPQSIGIYPPTTPPANMKIQIIFLVLM